MASSFMDSFENEDIKNGFWICNTYGNPITLSRTAIELFSDLLKAVKVYHDQSQGHGNLLGGAFVNGGHVFLLNEVTGGDPILNIKKDLEDFKYMVSTIEASVLQQTGTNATWSYMSYQFHRLYQLLPKYSGIDGLRSFSFWVRNNPYFLNDTGRFLLVRKVITLYETDKSLFASTVVLSELQGWVNFVTNPALLAVKEFRRHPSDPHPLNHLIYQKTNGSIVFFRNAAGHIRENNSTGGVYLGDGAVLRMLEFDLPSMLPTWYYSVIENFDLHPAPCRKICGHSNLREFWEEDVSVFT